MLSESIKKMNIAIENIFGESKIKDQPIPTGGPDMLKGKRPLPQKNRKSKYFN